MPQSGETMRRKDREIRDKKKQLKIVENAETVRIAFAVNNEAYIVAMSFGFVWEKTLKLYLHCASEGKKIDMLQQNDNVCFQMETDTILVIDTLACRWGMNYSSIIGRGQLSIVTDEEERVFGLNRLMKNYGKKGGNAHFAAEILQNTLVLRLDVEELTAKEKQ